MGSVGMRRIVRATDPLYQPSFRRAESSRIVPQESDRMGAVPADLSSCPFAPFSNAVSVFSFSKEAIRIKAGCADTVQGTQVELILADDLRLEVEIDPPDGSLDDV